jgi:hypothetical protein
VSWWRLRTYPVVFETGSGDPWPAACPLPRVCYKSRQQNSPIRTEGYLKDMFGGKSPLAKIFGSPVYLSRDLIRPHICRFLRSRSGHLLAVDINSWVGLFAHLEWFLEISLHCERHNLTPCFMSTSPQYVDPARGPDWFSYFFENLRLSPEDWNRVRNGRVPICRIDGIRQLGLPENYDLQLTLDIASRLVRKYIGINQTLLDRVEAFRDRYLKDKCVLGIHFRGTDKRAEAPPVSYTEFKAAICEFLNENGSFDCLFVASDEQRFVDFIERELGRQLSVVSHDDQERSRSAVAVHRSKEGDRYRKGEEAVLNCLLLSRCDALMKNASILSGWSKLFNPELPVILLNRPFEGQLWFPDRELVSRPKYTPKPGESADLPSVADSGP